MQNIKTVILEEDQKISNEVKSIKFYKEIYRQSCNSFWTIRISFLLLAILGMIIFSLSFGAAINSLLFIKNEIFNFQIFFFFIGIAIVMVVPFSYCIFVNVKKKKRSPVYELYLLNTKINRELTDDKIDLLLQDIDNLNLKFKRERDYILKLFIKMCKLLIFPITAVIFKAVTVDMSVTLILATFLFSILFSFLLALWNDFETLELIRGMGIKNDYLLSIVKAELIYMKEIKG